MQNGYEGFAALGDLLTGGVGRRAESSYYKGVHEGASASRDLDLAREERARRMAREALPDAIRSAGLEHPELASAILGMATGQPNLGQLTDGYKDLGEMELQRQQVEAMKAGNTELANRLAAVRSDKSYEPVRAVDGNLIPSGVALGDPGFKVQPLPQTQATVDLRHAQAHKVAQPPAPHAGTHSSGGGSADDQVLAEARAAIAKGADVHAVRKRLQERGYGALARKL